jgi:hypothetical protein
MAIQHQVSDGLRVPRGPEDFAVIPPQQVQIMIEIGGVALQIVLDAQLRAEERAGQFRPQFLAGILRRATIETEGSIQSIGMAGPVTQFVIGDSIIMAAAGKSLGRRQINAIFGGPIQRQGPFVKDPGAAAVQDSLQMRFPIPGVIDPPRRRCAIRFLQGGDALDLRGMINPMWAQQRNRLSEGPPLLVERGFLGGIVGVTDFESLEKIDRRPSRPGLDLPTSRLRLLVPAPARIIE